MTVVRPPRRRTSGPRWHKETFTTDDDREIEFEVLASASGSLDSGGPMIRENREYIARRGATYYVIEEDDYGTSFNRLRHFKHEKAGIAAAVRKSSAFILSHDGYPVSLWVDEDEGVDLVDETWDPEFDEPPTPAQEELWQTVIRDNSGIVLAGPQASPTLPTSEPCYALLGKADDVMQLARFGIWAARVDIDIDDNIHGGLLTEALPEVIVIRLGLHLGDGRVWRLTADAVELIDCEAEEIVARTLRDRV